MSDDAAIAAQFIADCRPFIIDDETNGYGHAMSDTPTPVPDPEPEPDEPDDPDATPAG